MAIWDDVIPSEDLKMFAKAKMGGKVVYEKKPAIIIVDMTYGFVDDAYPLGCSKMGWPAARAIKRLLNIRKRGGYSDFFH